MQTGPSLGVYTLPLVEQTQVCAFVGGDVVILRVVRRNGWPSPVSSSPLPFPFARGRLVSLVTADRPAVHERFHASEQVVGSHSMIFCRRQIFQRQKHIPGLFFFPSVTPVTRRGPAQSARSCIKFRGLHTYHADPARHLRTTDWELGDLL